MGFGVHLIQGIRNGLRAPLQQPGVTLFVTLTLGFGVGVNVAIFSLLDSLVDRPPLNVRAPDRLVRVHSISNYTDYRDIAARARSLDITVATRVDRSVGRGESALQLRFECVGHSYFELLGVQPMLGRTFARQDDRGGAPRLVVLAHSFWSRLYEGDAAVIGTVLRIGGQDYTIVGVGPAGFSGVEMQAADAWTPVAASPNVCSATGTSLIDSRDGHWLNAIGRIRDGFTLAQAVSEFSQYNTTPVDRSPVVGSGRTVEPFYESGRHRQSREWLMSQWLLGGAGVVLLIVCVNVGTLLSLRNANRRREIAVRLQLGATRGHVLTQLLFENLAVATLCGVPAIIAAGWTRVFLSAFIPDISLGSILSLRVFLVLCGLVIGVGLLSGSGPAMKASRTDPRIFLLGGSALATRQRSPTLEVLLALQFGLAVVLVMVATLFDESVKNLERDLGYDLDRVVVATVDLAGHGYGSAAEVESIFALLLQRVRGIPGIKSASVTSQSLLDTGAPMAFVAFRRPASTHGAAPMINAVLPGYFEAIGTELVSGRGFSASDTAGSEPVMIEVDPETWTAA